MREGISGKLAIASKGLCLVRSPACRIERDASLSVRCTARSPHRSRAAFEPASEPSSRRSRSLLSLLLCTLPRPLPHLRADLLKSFAMLVQLPLVAAAAFATAVSAVAVPADIEFMKKSYIERLQKRSTSLAKRNSLTTGVSDATILNFALTLEVRLLSCASPLPFEPEADLPLCAAPRGHVVPHGAREVHGRRL